MALTPIFAIFNLGVQQNDNNCFSHMYMGPFKNKNGQPSVETATAVADVCVEKLFALYMDDKLSRDPKHKAQALKEERGIIVSTELPSIKASSKAAAKSGDAAAKEAMVHVIIKPMNAGQLSVHTEKMSKLVSHVNTYFDIAISFYDLAKYYSVEESGKDSGKTYNKGKNVE